MIKLRGTSLALIPCRAKFCSFGRHDDLYIVGAGPTGMMLSIILSKFKINHTLVDRRPSPTGHPQAHFINNRSMELIREFAPNVFENIVNQSPPSIGWR